MENYLSRGSAVLFDRDQRRRGAISRRATTSDLDGVCRCGPGALAIARVGFEAGRHP